jgi:pullulanase
MYSLGHAAFIQSQVITLTVTQPLSPSQLHTIKLNIHDRWLESLSYQHDHQQDGVYLYTFHTKQPLELGRAYFLVIEGIGSLPMNVNAALSFENFAHDYTYDGDDLGYRYQPQATTFKVWAPLASDVTLIFFDDHHQPTDKFPMIRQLQGVYAVTVPGNLHGKRYRYGITNSGIYHEVIDVYGPSLSRNSEYSVVVDFSLFTMPMHDEALPKFSDYRDAILYEAHVRDLTRDPTIKAPHPGTFLAATTQGLTTEKGHPAGFDYITSLGITHLQLLPITDYRSVNEFAINESYNWGYDPYHFFALEGSFASDPDDPTSRIKDFMTLVSRYHRSGIRINIDVVFNHVYDYQFSPFEKVVPGYYFRKLPNGDMSNGSFCGNDFASEKPMVRHLIVHAATFVVKTYHLDGFRFDLMGILDLKTLHAIEQSVKAIKPDFMLYGEGWNMPTHLPQELKGITEHSQVLPNFAFFNDTFRNTLKGGNNEHDASHPGYATGLTHGDGNLPYLFLGSSDSTLGHPKVYQSYQSINYVECHDNNTFYDKLLACQPQEEAMTHYRRIIFASSLILFADGIPFFHMAQEVAGSKQGDHNSYQSGDKINQFHYRWIDERPWMVQAFKDLISIRKSLRQLGVTSWHKDQLRFQALDHGAWQVTYLFGQQPYIMFFNPSLHPIQLPADVLNKKMIFDGEKLTNTPLSMSHLPPIRCLVLAS